MGIITEYIKAVAQALKHPDKVIEGWVNDAKFERGELAEDEAQEVIRRRAICETCPFMSRNAIAAGNYASDRPDDHCIHCKCPITKKTASLESNCGIESYNRKFPNRPMPLKWEVYIKKQNDNADSKTV